MKTTIYISDNEFRDFLQLHYLTVSAKHFKTGKNKNITIELNQLYQQDKKSYLFLSAITNISMPDDSFFPQLRVLYGIPAGILTHRNETIKNKKTFAKEIKVSSEDKLYVFVRRAMLFMQVWSIKNMDASLVKKNVLQLFDNDEKRSLFIEMLQAIATINDYPQTKPAQTNIDDQLYDYQIIWLGKAIGTKLLNGNRMSEDERLWFISLSENKQAPVPASLSSCETLIAGYTLALKAYNKGHNDVNYILELLNQSIYHNNALRMDIFSAALFFLGLTENKADIYYMTAAAKALFYATEITAFKFAHEPGVAVRDIEGYDEISEAILQPIANCTQYYKTKNPGICHKESYQYTGGENAYPAKLPILKPYQVVPFLKEHKLAIGYYKALDENVFITDNFSLYKSLQNKVGNLLYFSQDNKLQGNLSGMFMDTPIITDSTAVHNFLTNRRIPVTKTNNLFQVDKDEWVVITGNYELNMLQKQLLTMTALAKTPKKIYVFNFYEPKHESAITELFDSSYYKMQGKNKKDKMSKKINTTTEPEKNNGTLQQEMQLLFPNTKVNVLSSPTNEGAWEMVNLGIGLLQQTQLENCILIETREKGNTADNYINIVRCFSDVIVYDDNQRYMFMNL